MDFRNKVIQMYLSSLNKSSYDLLNVNVPLLSNIVKIFYKSGKASKDTHMYRTKKTLNVKRVG